MKKIILILLLTYQAITVWSQKMFSPEWVDAVTQEMSLDFTQTPIFRLPKMVVCKNGDIVIGCEAKENTGRASFHAVSVSTDGGHSFEAKRCNVTLHELVYDNVHDRIFSYAGTTFYASDDHGKTWYDYKSRIHTQRPETFDEVSMSPTSGIQLSNGILAIPLRWIRYFRNDSGEKQEKIDKTVNFVLYSKDYGKNWYQTVSTDDNIIADEVTIIEYKKNQIMLNSRGGTEFFWEKSNHGRRVFVPRKKSNSNIDKWEIKQWVTEPESDDKLYDPICNASIIKGKIGWRTVSLFCNPYMPGEHWPRKNLVLQASRDFKHWKKVAQLTPEDYPVLGYSTMAFYNGRIYFAYEDEHQGIQFCELSSLKRDILNAIR